MVIYLHTSYIVRTLISAGYEKASSMWAFWLVLRISWLKSWTVVMVVMDHSRNHNPVVDIAYILFLLNLSFQW